MEKGNNCRLIGRVRRVFHDQELFEATHERRGVTALKRAGRKVGRFWLNVSMGLAVATVMFYYLPNLAFKYIPGWNQARVLGESVEASDGATMIFDEQILWQPDWTQDQIVKMVRPKYDFSVPEGRWLRAEKAEIEAEIATNASIEVTREVNAILEKGLYLYPEYAEVGKSGRPVIIAGHHYNSWMSPTESRKSFQNLDKLAIGDRVEVLDDFKIWTYEVVKIEQATAVAAEMADLVMYTCVHWWDSDLRLFVYAKLMEE